MNGSRLFSCRYNDSLNPGRVQTTTLAMIVKRDMELKKISELISVPENELHKLSETVKEKICGMYSMEYEEGGDNSALIVLLKEMVALR